MPFSSFPFGTPIWVGGFRAKGDGKEGRVLTGAVRGGKGLRAVGGGCARARGELMREGELNVGEGEKMFTVCVTGGSSDFQ